MSTFSITESYSIKNSLKISIVIPTRNRPESLANLLFSILKQTTLPDEVLVIDDSDDTKTAELVKKLSNAFLSRDIVLKHLRGNNKSRSISNARNIGAHASNGEIIFFIDDDVILERHYIKEILKVYDASPTAKGVQGFIINIPFNPLNIRHLIFNSMNKIFFLSHYEKDKCSQGRGLCYPYSPERIIECEWLHGSNMSVRREIFTNFWFDDYFTLKGRSIGEDVRLTSKINFHFPHSLFMNPKAKVCHMHFPRKVDKYSLYSLTAYFIYRFIATHKLTIKNMTLAFWTQLGRLIINGFSFLVSRNIHALFWLVKSYLFAINHLSDVKNGDFQFINSTLN
ncbi:MAG: glycosyltransferase family 2 protein [Candidatus Bathyarchaeales archaeon]